MVDANKARKKAKTVGSPPPNTGRNKGDQEAPFFKTRVCIQNLPKHNKFDEQRLRSLIGDRTVTDVKWVGRRMAIVGFKTSDEAVDVISQLNGTYCDTSKLVVEYARKPKQKEKGKESTKDTKNMEGKVDTKKVNLESESSQKKRKFWSNDDNDVPVNTDSTDIGATEDASSKAVLDDTMAFLRSKQTDSENLQEDNIESGGDDQSDHGEEDNEPHIDSTRLFLRNLPYSVTADQVGESFESYGTVVECHIAHDEMGNSKGFGFVKFSTAPAAKKALEEMNGTEFCGRILWVLPARPGATTPSNHHNAAFVRTEAVLDTVASRMNTTQSSILAVKDGLSAGDAAVRMALAETAIVQENRDFLASRGVVETSERRSRSCFLVKNLPHDTSVSELQSIFHNASSVDLAPSHTLAMIKFLDSETAQLAYRKHAYRRFKTVPLYLEWASIAPQEEEKKPAPVEIERAEEDEIVGPTATLFVKNLNFTTTEDGLKEFFSDYFVRSARIPQKIGSVRGRIVNQSMGYGFVEFESKQAAQKALAQKRGSTLDGHALELQPRSDKSTASSKNLAPSKKGKNKKLVVRNVPFQATRSELLQLFGSFGTIRNLRLPKKFDGNHRGFCFIEYVDDAETARQANTHLYGRHLVIDYAEDEE